MLKPATEDVPNAYWVTRHPRSGWVCFSCRPVLAWAGIRTERTRRIIATVQDGTLIFPVDEEAWEAAAD